MSCIPSPKVTATNSTGATNPAPAAQGASALRLGVTGDPLDDELLNGRTNAILGKLRLRVGNSGAGLGGGLSGAVDRPGGVPAGSSGSASSNGGFVGTGSATTGGSTPTTSYSSYNGPSKLRLIRDDLGGSVD